MVEEKHTEHLLNSLKKAENFTQINEENQPYYIDDNITNALNQLLQQKNVKKSEVIRGAGLPEVSGYQYFDGRRKPTRDKVLALSFGFELDETETNLLLKQTSYAQLYAKNKRDAVLIFALAHHYTIFQTEELLFQSELPTLLKDN